MWQDIHIGRAKSSGTTSFLALFLSLITYLMIDAIQGPKMCSPEKKKQVMGGEKRDIREETNVLHF